MSIQCREISNKPPLSLPLFRGRDLGSAPPFPEKGKGEGGIGFNSGGSFQQNRINTSVKITILYYFVSFDLVFPGAGIAVGREGGTQR